MNLFRHFLSPISRSREEGRGSKLETAWSDVRFGLRTFRRNPGFTAVALLTLALGIGANTAIFSMVQGVVLSPLAYRDPDRLVAIWQTSPHAARLSISLPDLKEWQRNSRSFEQMAGVRWYSFNLSNPGSAEHLAGFEVSSGFFNMLGVNLSLGREFSPQEDQQGGAPVAIINDRLWRERFSRSRDALGKSVTLDGASYTIIGVLPPDFHFVSEGDVYIPLAQGDPMFNSRRFPGVLSIARLKPNVSIGQAQAEMSAVQGGLDQSYPDTDQGFGAAVFPLKQVLVENISGTLLLLLGAVAVVLLIACANVANLLLARSAARTREFAVRSALGANQTRIVRQLVTESVVLSFAGGILGLLVAKGVLRVVLSTMAASLERTENITLNGAVLAFALLVSVVVGVLFGLAPALKTLSFDLESALKTGSRGSTARHHRVQNALVIGQTALTIVLLAGSALLFRTLHDLWQVNPGFQAQGLITFKVGLSPSVTKDVSSTQIAYQQLIDRVRSIPGVESVDVTNLVPLSQTNNFAPFWIGTREATPLAEAPRLLLYWTGPDYLQTMKIPLLQGRYVTSEDSEGSERVVVIDSVLARTYFHDQNPIGQSITVNIWGDTRIVGVASHVRHAGLGDPADYKQPQAYASLRQLPKQAINTFYRELTMMVRAQTPSSTLMPAIKTAIYGAGRDQPVYDMHTMQDIVAQSMSSQQFPMVLLGAFAGLALLLASVGIYGVISYSIEQRVHEIGIRLALGAKRAGVLRMVLRQGLRLIIVGVAVGIVSASMLTRALWSFSRLLYGVTAGDPTTFVAVALVLSVVGLAACYIPARRAMRTDPVIALRHE